MWPKTQLDTPNQRLFYEYLSKLSLLQFKQFYCLFVHYWTNYKCFISQQNLFNLWCELNQLCHESDESFPDQYDDHEVMKSFCMTYPYYFIDKPPSKVRIFLPQPQKERHTNRCVFSFCRCDLAMIDLENASAFSRVLHYRNLRHVPTRRKTKVQNPLPQPNPKRHPQGCPFSCFFAPLAVYWIHQYTR